MNPRPISVKPLNDHELLITFQNNEVKIFDVKPLLKYPLYKDLNNSSFFKTVKADGSCVYWNDDVDLCPDMVYEESRAVSVDDAQGASNEIQRHCQN